MDLTRLKAARALFYIPVIAAGLLLSFSCSREGCTDELATNYNSSAKEDDGSCKYLNKGCTDPRATNFDSTAVENDGSCEYPENMVLLHFDHMVDNYPLELNKKSYTNVTGYPYEVSRIQYLISKIKFHGLDGTVHDTRKIHYRDLEIKDSRTLVLDSIPNGEYSFISFIFGLPDDLNKSFTLPNEPRYNNFEWPEGMGGGYHFMKFEGKYLDSSNTEKAFNMHLGRLFKDGTWYNTHFEVKVPKSAFTMNDDRWEIQIYMNMNEWFRDPNMLDLNALGPAIMGNPAAQTKLSANGKNAFSTGFMFRR